MDLELHPPRGRPQLYTPEQQRAALALYRGGMSKAKIAVRYGCTEHTVRRMLERAEALEPKATP